MDSDPQRQTNRSIRQNLALFWSRLLEKKVNLLVPGAQKAGTTALCYYLNHSSSISIPVSEKQELHYFSNPSYGVNEYHNELAKIVDFKCRYFGEKSTSYLPNLECHRRIFRYNPKMKFIITLRDPVARAFSRYCDLNRDSNYQYKKDFYHCIDKSVRHNHHWTWWGCYADQLKSLYAYFPKKQVFILFQEDLVRDPQRVMGAVFDFLRLPMPSLIPAKKHANPHVVEIPEDAKAILEKFYAQRNDDLKTLLNIDKLPW